MGPVGSSELYEVTIKAPDGTVFAPVRKLGGGRSNKSAPKSYEFPHIYDKECDTKDENTQMGVWGFMSPEHTYIEAYQKWPDDDLIKPWRRIPVDSKSKKHDYWLEVLICPKLGQRLYGYLLFIALTATSFLAYLFTGVNPGGISAQSFLMFVPLVAMIIAGFDVELYTRKKLLWFPKRLVYACVVMGFIGFIIFCMASGSIVPDLGVRITAAIGFAACITCLILCAAWTLNHYRRSKWTKKPGAYDKKHLWIYGNRST